MHRREFLYLASIPLAAGLAPACASANRSLVTTPARRFVPVKVSRDREIRTIAGAQWSPYTVYDDDRRTPAFNEQFVRAARLSHREYQNLVGDYYGVRWIENYVISERPFQSAAQGGSQGLENLYPDSREVGAR